MTSMRRNLWFLLLLLGASASTAHAQSFGKYEGAIQTEWLDTDGRRMRLLAPFKYVDPKGNTWTAPAGWEIDGASIPVFAWSVIGGPFNGRYRDASVIHDVACDQKIRPWEEVHEAFYWAMMASGVEPWRAKVMYAAVFHFGPRWPRTVTVAAPENQTAVAQKQALAQAEPGSDAVIVRVRPQPAPAMPAPPPSTTGAGGEAVARVARFETVEMQIQPPPRTLSEKDFDALKNRIIEAEGGGQRKPRMRGFNAPEAQSSPAAPGAPQTSGLRKRSLDSDETASSPEPALAGDAGVSLLDIRGFKP